MRVGSYEVLTEIGRGGCGVVFEARSSDGSAVALKVLKSSTPVQRARFDRERRLLDQLGRKEGFVPLIDSGDGPSGAWVAMPFIRGGTLRQRLAKGPLAVEETVVLGESLARALGRAHAAGVVHRDLKPENILFTSPGAESGEWGEPLIADLGLAKHFRDDTPGASRSVSVSTEGFRGTAGYMSPEQMRDAKSVGPTADVFALGAVLYECLAGVPAFRADSLLELMAAVDRGACTPLGRFRADVPGWLLELIARALAGDPARRFADGAAVLAALEKRAVKEGRPRGRALPALALLVLGGLVAGGVLLARRESVAVATPPPPPPRAVATGPSMKIEEPLPGAWCESDAIPVRARLRGGAATEATIEVEIVTLRGTMATTDRVPVKPDGTIAATVRTGGVECPCNVRVTAYGVVGIVASAGVTVKLAGVPRSPYQPGITLVGRTTLPSGRPLRVYSWLLPDGRKTEMVYLPLGPFRSGAEGKITETRGTFIGRHETTRREMLAFCEATGTRIPSTPPFAPELERIDEHPATNLTAAHVKGYLEWSGLRLPTAAEWEKAACGIEPRRYPWGDAWAAGRSNHADSSAPPRWAMAREEGDDGFPYSAPVGSFPSGVSPFGCLDMSGNATEQVDGAFRGGSWRSNREASTTLLRLRFEGTTAPGVDEGLRVAVSEP